jgi:DNA invertase Pin-like site-specific DNA recombinase
MNYKEYSANTEEIVGSGKPVDPIGLFPCVSLLHNQPMIYCYARVSTAGQSEAAQVRQLRAAGARRVFREVAAGAKTDRPQLRRLLAQIGPGDVVTVTRIDRLARSIIDLFAIVKGIVDAGGQFRSLAEPWAETSTSTGHLMLAVLGGLVDVERDLIRTRTAEGRSRAQKRGQHMGRPPKLTEAQKAEARRRRAEGATLKELAESYHVGLATISRLAS